MLQNRFRGRAMSERFRVKTIVFQTGERLPVLLTKKGTPDFISTKYILSMLRSVNHSSSTIESTLRAIIIFKYFCAKYKINLNIRFSQGLILFSNEVADLAWLCRFSMAEIASSLQCNGASDVSLKSTKPYSKLSRFDAKEISLNLCSFRLTSIKKYLLWLVDVYFSCQYLSDPIGKQLLEEQRKLHHHIKAITPKGKDWGASTREGLSEKALKQLLTTISPTSPNNPWFDEHTRFRNELIILWLYKLGLRRGELLSVLVTDFTASSDLVSIQRRPDNPADPRVKQPKVKTLGRDIIANDELLLKTEVYIKKYRARCLKAKYHSFLFVGKKGKPLSVDGFSKIFSVLRSVCDELPENFSAHILRHTWNDEFSKVMDEGNVSEEKEKNLRSYLMGWSPTSRMGAVYTKRHTRLQAQKASLTLQNNLRKPYGK